ncbi:hypothetical protein [Legionella spiritensis]|uniref:Uncharacterized protein n=1 Tax=Legionella spiritensis TaxID=452 RepID=A0A0W0YWX8_LEGSP|nr:hypothetical protein [Legionella spiritensis]KTD61421.1 hypothetical protein Lspi_2663 [Legionella spiritensis]SNV33384.1 Uncharacterised protein [Legionella spiritensis]
MSQDAKAQKLLEDIAIQLKIVQSKKTKNSEMIAALEQLKEQVPQLRQFDQSPEITATTQRLIDNTKQHATKAIVAANKQLQHQLQERLLEGENPAALNKKADELRETTALFTTTSPKATPTQNRSCCHSLFTLPSFGIALIAGGSLAVIAGIILMAVGVVPVGAALTGAGAAGILAGVGLFTSKGSTCTDMEYKYTAYQF